MNDDAITAHTCVSDLLQVSLKGIDTFQEAAAETEGGLHALFAALTLQRQEFVMDLIDLMQPPKPGTGGARAQTPLVTPHPRHTHLEKRPEEAILEECAREENEAVMAYSVVLMREDLPPTVKEVFEQQLACVEFSRARILECQKAA